MKYLITACLILLIAGCSTLSQLSAYSVTQGELETLLDNELVSLERRVSILGIPLMLSVDDMSVLVGPEGRDVVQLGSVATTTVNVFGLEYDARINLRLEGQPYYDQDKKAIYLRSLTLLDSTVDAGGFRGNLAPLSHELMTVLNRYLKTNPVYQLDTSSAAVNLVTKVPMTLYVEQEKLVLRPQSD